MSTEFLHVLQQRTPQQRLDWLPQTLETACLRGSLIAAAEARS